MNPNEQPFIDLFEEDEIDRLFDVAFPPPNAQSTFEDGEEQASMFIMFLQACLSNRGWSREDLADSMATDAELIDAIFDGTIPESEIEGDILVDLAHAVGYEPTILSLMLDYTRTPQTDLNDLVERLVRSAVDGDAPAIEGNDINFETEELHTIQTELANLLLQGFGGYYDAQREDDQKQRLLYDRVIKAIKAAITNYQADVEEAQAMILGIKDSYRAEIKAIQTMIEELRTVRAVEAIVKNDDKTRNSQQVRIIEKSSDVSRDLMRLRIIEYKEENM